MIPRYPIGAVVALTLAGFGCVASACSSPSTPAAAPTTTTTSRPAPEITTPTVTIDGHSYRVPTEFGSTPIVPSVDSGGQIILTDKGFLPHELFAEIGQTITWTNLSSRTVTIAFQHMPGTTRHTLSVGGSFTYSSSTLISFEYASSSGYHGIVHIGQFQTP
jgi:hypothetical protein